MPGDVITLPFFTARSRVDNGGENVAARRYCVNIVFDLSFVII